ncbi:Scr1 family TA system antitoxin-like transcriptional regulator [Streptomyces avermitilis]|uniref:Scr1 family TA system antitoxin-like transcriptional regulator n=1 Tax=Streptomyces avermitilis TaxID=33903 RepID=UPI00382F4132
MQKRSRRCGRTRSTMGLGGPNTARAQLGYLLETSKQPTITILVIPFGEAGFPASGQPITCATGPVPHLDTVTLDTDHGCEFPHADVQLDTIAPY